MRVPFRRSRRGSAPWLQGVEMPIFVRRREPPRARGGYQLFRPFVRDDFSECCAYCLLHEILAAGPDNFHLDHFRPKSHPLFAHLRAEYYNLYYSCSVCNRYKSNRWPDDEMVEAGLFFVDPCQEAFSDHFLESQEGRWVPLTRAGEFTEAMLRLNREHLVKLRARLRSLAVKVDGTPIRWDHPCREHVCRLLNV
jgi:hypothetical protein